MIALCATMGSDLRALVCLQMIHRIVLMTDDELILMIQFGWRDTHSLNGLAYAYLNFAWTNI